MSQIEESLLSDSKECDQNDDLVPDDLSGEENQDQNQQGGRTQGNANIFFSVTIIMKTVIGAGILSLPFTFSRLGWLLSIFTIILVLGLVHLTCVFLLNSKNLSRHNNYTTIGDSIFQSENGKFAMRIVSSMIIIGANIGVGIVQLIILKGSIKKILDSCFPDASSYWYTQKHIILLILVVVIFPLTLIKNISKLRFLTFTGITGISTFVVTLLVTFIIQMKDGSHQGCNAEMKPVQNHYLQILAALPNVILALGYHSNLFPVFRGLKNANDKRTTTTTFIATCCCAAVYSLVGTLGYCLFGRGIQSNFLLAFDKGKVSNGIYFMLNIPFLISVFCSFPVVFFAGRNNVFAIGTIVYNKWKKRKDRKDNINRSVENDSEEQVRQQLQQPEQRKVRREKKMFVLKTTLFYLVIVGIAMGVDDLQTVFNIVGAISANSLVFILPSLFYFRLVDLKKKRRTAKYFAAIGMFCFFILFGIFSVVSNLTIVNEK